MKNIFWTAYCENERIIAIGEIEKIVNSYGYISDFKQFSDIALMIKIELEKLKIDKLYNALKSYIRLNDFEKLNSTSTNERIIFLNITFKMRTLLFPDNKAVHKKIHLFLHLILGKLRGG